MLGWIIKTVNAPMGGIMYNDKFNQIADTIKDLGKSCEQLGIQYTTKLSTLEVAVSQQMIQIKKLEEEVTDLGQVKSYLLDERDSLFNALIVLDPGYVPDFYTLLHNVPVDVQEEYNPVPYPYTHPIRETEAYSKVREPR